MLDIKLWAILICAVVLQLDGLNSRLHAQTPSPLAREEEHYPPEDEGESWIDSAVHNADLFPPSDLQGARPTQVPTEEFPTATSGRRTTKPKRVRGWPITLPPLPPHVTIAELTTAEWTDATENVWAGRGGHFVFDDADIEHSIRPPKRVFHGHSTERVTTVNHRHMPEDDEDYPAEDVRPHATLTTPKVEVLKPKSAVSSPHADDAGAVSTSGSAPAIAASWAQTVVLIHIAMRCSSPAL